MTSGSFLKDKSSSEEGLAGPSQTDSPTSQGLTSSPFTGRFLKKLYFRDDSTCVLLGENKDCISASYIKIVNPGEEYYYIATQGPLPGTTDDFWRMILENNSNVIVMITREVENGVIECHHCWPISTKKPVELKSCRVFLENYQILQNSVVRIFQVVRKSFNFMNIVGQMREQRYRTIQTKVYLGAVYLLV
ncbi:LOW QUALITY PROTEIN: tyrosine-protein phosphatase non-receptor type 20 [Vicugna pacos]|uniref:LOW QUALITY PROTEIN: tyrosine-protein phosphatase non-receptor type 20 n=1 Tax=Vicugna pacos TaxID=30538 RepID=A0ABM5E287_VICPA